MKEFEAIKKYLINHNAAIFRKDININLLKQTDRLAYITGKQRELQNIEQAIDLTKLPLSEKEYYLALFKKKKYVFNVNKIQDLNILDKTLVSLAGLINENDKDIVRSYLSGLLIYLGRNYKIDLASLVAKNLYNKLGKLSLLDNYQEFIFLNLQKSGAVGVINPLNKNTLSKSEYEEWKYANTIFTYLFLKDYLK